MTKPINSAEQATPDAAPGQPPTKPKGLAIASLVLGAASCAVFLNLLLIPSVLAIVFGTISLRRTRKGTAGGEAQARAGRICGIVGLAVTLVFVATWGLAGLWVSWTANRHTHVGPNPSSAELIRMIEAHPNRINAKDEDGRTPLHTAAICGYKDVAELLIAKGADVNARGKYERTPLHEAVANGRRDVVELLIAKGAHINARDFVGCAPLHSAKSTEVVELLIAHGADVNAEDDTGTVRLHGAAACGKKEIAELLISKRADINAKDHYGQTPLSWAAGNGHIEVVELLIAKGANLNTRDKDGKTALQWAIERLHPAIADMLRKAGAKE